MLKLAERDPEDPTFDLAASVLRHDAADITTFVEALASKLESALPDLCTVERRRRGLFSTATRVSRITVRLGRRLFTLRWHRGELAPEIESQVHDMRRTTEQLRLEDWLVSLQTELENQAASSSAARDALDRLLNS